MQTAFVLGQSPRFLKAIEIADDYAKTSWPILILGETGVGKELVAHRIHSLSRPSAPFIPVNCGAVPPTLFESELFGYERGAFSGALQRHRGLIRSAQGGTLFLDEIGDLELALQVKLLRWLDSGEVRGLGSVKAERVDARFIAATHVDLEMSVAQGTFRLDLFERLGVLTVHIPPLRERREDICLIAGSILEGLGARFEASSLTCLETFDWPGNVRQLRNVLFRASARSKGRIDGALLDQLVQEERHFAQTLRSNQNHDILDSSLDEVERRVILNRIRRCHGNKKQAAKELGIAKSTLHEKIKRWRVDHAIWL